MPPEVVLLEDDTIGVDDVDLLFLRRAEVPPEVGVLEGVGFAVVVGVTLLPLLLDLPIVAVGGFLGGLLPPPKRLVTFLWILWSQLGPFASGLGFDLLPPTIPPP